MKRAYYYLFYKLYRHYEKGPSVWWSDGKAGITIIALEIWIAFSLVNYYNVLVNRYFELNKLNVIAGALIICGINYLAFGHTDVWKDYVKEFDTLPKRKNLIFSFYLMSQVDWSKYR